MDAFENLKQIFKGILVDLKLTEKEVLSITSIVRTPNEMAKIVDELDKNPNIKYDELFQIVLNSINFDIVIDN